MAKSKTITGGLALLTALAVFTTLAAGDDVEGRWTAKLGWDQDFVHLRLRIADERGDSRIRSTVDASELEGLDPADLKAWSAELAFEWPRQAGTLIFEGRRGWFSPPSGEFRFRANPEFVAHLGASGYGEPSDYDLITLAVHDVSDRDVAGLGELGYRSLDDIVRLTVRNVEVDYVVAMQELGYRPSIDDVIRLHGHGVRAQGARVRRVGPTRHPR